MNYVQMACGRTEMDNVGNELCARSEMIELVGNEMLGVGECVEKHIEMVRACEKDTTGSRSSKSTYIKIMQRVC